MKIIEGTPEEIREYQKNQESKKPESLPGAKNPQRTLHWSKTKQEWIWVEEMNAAYIFNVLRKMMSAHNFSELETHAEFRALINTLAKYL